VLPEEERRYLVQLGEQALAKTWPALPATLYLEYARTATDRGMRAFISIAAHLQSLTLAECVEAKGRFLEAAPMRCGRFAKSPPGVSPPCERAKSASACRDTAEPIVDLFAAETVSACLGPLSFGTGVGQNISTLRERANASWVCEF